MTNLDVTELAIADVNSDTNVRVLPAEQVVCVDPSFILFLILQPCLNTFVNLARYLVGDTSTASEVAPGFSFEWDTSGTSELLGALLVEHVNYYCNTTRYVMPVIHLQLGIGTFYTRRTRRKPKIAVEANTASSLHIREKQTDVRPDQNPPPT